MAPRAFNSSNNIQQPAKRAGQHNPRANRTIHGRKFDANGQEIKPGAAQEILVQATCPRCLQVHLLPPNGGSLVSNTRKWWRTQRPATKRERKQYINNIDCLALMVATEEAAVCEGNVDTVKGKGGKNAARGGGGKNEKPPRRDDELNPEAKKKEEMGRERKQRRSDMAHMMDDPVDEGVKLALDPEATLPSDGKPVEHKERHFSTGEKYHDIDTMLTMDDIRHQEPTFVIKTVTRRRRGKKGGKKTAAGENQSLAGDEDEYDFVDGAEDDNDDVLSVVEWDDLE